MRGSANLILERKDLFYKLEFPAACRSVADLCTSGVNPDSSGSGRSRDPESSGLESDEFKSGKAEPRSWTSCQSCQKDHTMNLKKTITPKKRFAGNSKMFLMFLVSFFLMGLPAHIPAAKNAGGQNTCNTISATALQHRLKIGQGIVIVDVRNSREFEKARIPGSINIPLHFVKSKAFLKSRTLVLVDGGYTDRQTKETCRVLRNEGFMVSILSGGLISWYRQGGPVNGDLLALNKYKNISPLRFYREKNREDRIIIDVSVKQYAESIKLMPNAKHIPVQVRSQTAVAQVEKSILKQKINPLVPVVIFNRTGEQYGPIESIIKKAGLKNVYFLKGGLQGYQRFLQNLALSRQPRESRIKTTSKCPSCGRQQEKGFSMRKASGEEKARKDKNKK